MNKEKKIYTVKDFEKMDWHDCSIYGVSFLEEAYEFLLDIDYILEWIKPTDSDEFYEFLVAPATLVFKNVYDICFDLEFDCRLNIESITRDEKVKCKNINNEYEWFWKIECQEGIISFRSLGFEMFINEKPTLSNSQRLGRTNGIKFVRAQIK